MPEFTYRAVAEEFDFAALNAALEEFFARHSWSTARLLLLEFVLEELTTNSIKYGGAPRGMIEIGVEAENGEVELRATVADSGVPFNPLEAGEVDVTLPLEERDIGGLGIFLVKKRVRAIAYRRADGRNLVSVTL